MDRDGLYYVTLPFACGGVTVRTKRNHQTPGCPGYTACPRVVDGAPIFGRFWSVDASLTSFEAWVARNGGRMELLAGKEPERDPAFPRRSE